MPVVQMGRVELEQVTRPTSLRRPYRKRLCTSVVGAVSPLKVTDAIPEGVSRWYSYACVCLERLAILRELT